MMMTTSQKPQNSLIERISSRLDHREPAMLRFGKERFPVELQDIGVAGFGLDALVGLDIDDLVELEVSSDGGMDIYRCKVVFCRRKGHIFRIGLEIIEQEPDLVFLTHEGEEYTQLETL
ncbi:MAG: PilZ domain-containing protein [Magnetococcales bacterium]|nr:PilZ domain-containing protein [Magnetococcales bacterium]